VHRTSSLLTDKDVKTTKVVPSSSSKAVKISNAMKSYLENAKKYEKQMESLTEEYKTGRRHLANIMGVTPDQLTDNDVKKAIQYLMPSGLTVRKAKPALMKANYIMTNRKAPQFGMDGRPHHYMFYTGKPNYYEFMHTVALKLDELQKKEEFISDEHQGLSEINKTLIDSEWIDLPSLARFLSEPINDKDYAGFCKLMDYLLNHPLSKEENSFISKYRVLLKPKREVQSETLSLDKDGRRIKVAHGARKSAKCKLTVYEPGTGKFDISGQDLLYFSRHIDREQIMFPLHLSGMLGKVDVIVDFITKGGPTGKAGAVRSALSKALVCFVEQEVAVKMMIAGLLTSDPRRRERKKPGQEGARKKYTWKKR